MHPPVRHPEPATIRAAGGLRAARAWRAPRSVGDGIPIRRSTDLLRREQVGRDFLMAVPSEVPGAEPVAGDLLDAAG